jgi:hypothetical protein
MFFFFFFFRDELYEALKTDEGFMDLLRRGAHSTKGKRKKPIAEVDQSSHLDVDTLHDYILGSLNNEKMREIMDHLSECKECVRKVLEIRRLDKEVAKDFRYWMKGPVSKCKGSCSDDPR